MLLTDKRRTRYKASSKPDAPLCIVRQEWGASLKAPLPANALPPQSIQEAGLSRIPVESLLLLAPERPAGGRLETGCSFSKR